MTIDVPERCTCPAAGFCPVFKFTTTVREHELCQTNERYRRVWARGDSPQHHREHHTVGVDVPARWQGLGDTVAWLSKLATFGLVKMCGGCQSRRAWLNRCCPYSLDIWRRRLRRCFLTSGP